MLLDDRGERWGAEKSSVPRIVENEGRIVADGIPGVLFVASLSRARSVDPLFTAQLDNLHNGGSPSAPVNARSRHGLPRPKGNK